jgi:hypothetical protein
MEDGRQQLFRAEALRARREMHIIGDPLEIRPVSLVSAVVTVVILVLLIIGLLLFVRTASQLATGIG